MFTRIPCRAIAITLCLLHLVMFLSGGVVAAQSAAVDGLVAVTHPTEGFSLNLPGDWEIMPIGPSLTALSSQTNGNGDNSGTLMVASTTASRAFERLVQQAEDGSANNDDSGVHNETRFVNHPQGQAVLVHQYVDRAEIKGATYIYNLKIGETVWVVNCMASDSQDAIQPVIAICEQVGSSFRAP